MSSNTAIPKEFIPFEPYITQATLAYISFSIPNTKENYEHFVTLIEPKLHPSIVEIQQVPDPSENIFIRISANASLDTPGAVMEELVKRASDILDAEGAIKAARDILDDDGN